VTADQQTEEILALLDDEYARAILRQTVDEAKSAKELSDACGISLSTVYRRAERLVDVGLLAERRIATQEGTHYSMYEAQLDELTVSLTAEGVTVDITEKPPGDLADRFTEMWEGL
jgi:predicted transcriptional regulator